jgi:hypothetical protein
VFEEGLREVMGKRIISLLLSLGIWNRLDAAQPHLFQPEIIEDSIIKQHAIIDHEVIIIGRCLITSDVTFSENGRFVIYPASTLKLKGYPQSIILNNLKKNSIIFSDDTSWLVISPLGRVTLKFIEKPEYSIGKLIISLGTTLRLVSPWPALKSFFSPTFKVEIRHGGRIFRDLPPRAKKLYTLPKQ